MLDDHINLYLVPENAQAQHQLSNVSLIRLAFAEYLEKIRSDRYTSSPRSFIHFYFWDLPFFLRDSLRSECFVRVTDIV